MLQAKRKRDRMGDMKIVVAGCVAQQEGEQLLRRVPEVDLVMGECTARDSMSHSMMRVQSVPCQQVGVTVFGGEHTSCCFVAKQCSASNSRRAGSRARTAATAGAAAGADAQNPAVCGGAGCSLA